MIYFVQAGENGPVKIGFAIDFPARLRELQCAQHVTLIVLRKIDGAGRREERALHKLFAHRHIRGEWFNFDPEMLTATVSVGLQPERLRGSASQIIDALGGTKTVAEQLKCGCSVVSNWRRARIPARRWSALVAAFPGVTYEQLAASFHASPTMGS
jgi:hypothetical protein